MSSTLFEYFKKELPEGKILVRINPVTFDGLELIVLNSGEVNTTVRQFDQSIYEDLAADEFTEGRTLEFNLYLNGISKKK